MVKAVSNDRSLDAKQAVSIAKQNMSNVEYKITFSKDEDSGLTEFAGQGNKSNEDAIFDVVVERLTQEDLI